PRRILLVAPFVERPVLVMHDWPEHRTGRLIAKRHEVAEHENVVVVPTVRGVAEEAGVKFPKRLALRRWRSFLPESERPVAQRVERRLAHAAAPRTMIGADV